MKGVGKEHSMRRMLQIVWKISTGHSKYMPDKEPITRLRGAGRGKSRGVEVGGAEGRRPPDDKHNE